MHSFQTTDDTSGAELWNSDGTSEGTRLLQDINPGGDGDRGRSEDSYPEYFAAFAGKLFFSANDGMNGRELWIATINYLPISTNHTVTVAENSVYAFSSSDFPFTDADAEDSFQRIRITQLPSTGQLFIDTDDDNLQDDGEAVQLQQEISVANLAQLKFSPGAIAIGDPDANFQFQVSDGNDFSAAPTTMTMIVIPSLRDSDPDDGAIDSDTIDNDVPNNSLPMPIMPTSSVTGTDHKDLLTGTANDETLAGMGGNDRLFGGPDNDILLGDDGNDRLFGGEGDDLLVGGDGRDKMTGGDGADIFVIRPGKGFARIRDFDLKDDKLGIVKGEIRLGAIEVRPFQGNHTILLLNGQIIAGLEGINPDDLRRSHVALVEGDALG
jgi:ELWxxDGT repeat protein